MIFNRRQFISGSGSLFLMGSPLWNARAEQIQKRNIVIISLRGGMDGLAAVPYIGNRELNKARPQINVSTKNKLNSDFALNPRLRTIHQLWKEGQAAIVHATSIPYTERSHFEGQNLMESGSTEPFTTDSGWLGRGIDAANLNGLAVSLPMPLILRGESNPDNYYPTKMELPDEMLMQKIASTYQSGGLVSKTMNRLQNRSRFLQEKAYGYEAFNLADTAALELAREEGPRVAVFDINGFDTHATQGGEEGRHADYLAKFDRVVNTLKKGMGPAFDNTLILSLTEFGRMVEQNGGNGTEHGYGTAIFLAGGLVKKAQVLTDWPGLKKADRFEGRDLNVTIDARSIYCSAMAACFDTDFEKLRREAFFGASLQDYTTELFKV